MFHTAMLLPFVLPFLLGLAPKHPHNPKAMILQGAAGKTTVSFFTVPFNPEHLKDLQPGFEWHLGFAVLDTEVPLQIGGAAVPPARYKLGVVRGATADDWDILLEPFDLWRAKSQVQRARGDEAAQKARADVEAMLADLEAKGVPARFAAPTTSVTAMEAEHLELTVMFAGFDTAQRFSVEPASGMHMKLRIDFGDLHREIAIQEVFEKK